MKQPEDKVTAELPLPVPEGQEGADLFVPAPNWRRALEAAVAADPQGKLGVSLKLGVSRVYVSRVMTGSMPQAPAKFVERVVKMLMVVDCPYLCRPLQPAECRAFAARSYSQVSQFEVAHWRACRGCMHNPERSMQPAPGNAATVTAGAGAGAAP